MFEYILGHYRTICRNIGRWKGGRVGGGREFGMDGFREGWR